MTDMTPDDQPRRSDGTGGDGPANGGSSGGKASGGKTSRGKASRGNKSRSGARSGGGKSKGTGTGRNPSGRTKDAGGARSGGGRKSGGGKKSGGHPGPPDRVSELAGPLGRVLDRLPATQRRVLEYRMGLVDGHPHSLNDTATALGLGQTEARDIEARAFEHIREVIPLDRLGKLLDS